MSELPTYCDNIHRRARKQHTCIECEGVIQPGERYWLCSGLWSGDWQSFKTCEDCEQLRDEIERTLDRYPEEMPAFGELHEEIFNDHDEAPDWLFRYMDTRRKRNSPESPKGWMEQIEAELKEEIKLKAA